MTKTTGSIRVRSPKGYSRYRTIDPGRKGHLQLTLGLRRIKRGKRIYKSEVQKVTYPFGNAKDRRNAIKLARKLGCKRIVRKGTDWSCKPLLN